MYPMRREEGRFNVGECPNCREKLIGDVDRGEIFCPKCGFVLHDQAIDQSAEWKSADYEERMKRSRVGLPSTNTLHDFGLTTDISSDLRDSHDISARAGGFRAAVPALVAAGRGDQAVRSRDYAA